MNLLWRILEWTAGVLIVSLALVWLGDTLSVSHRMTHRTASDPIDTIKVTPIYLIPRKDGRAELDFGDPEDQMCVHALFSHLGYSPCWYVRRQSQKPIPIAFIAP
jgi:hypothetical protein